MPGPGFSPGVALGNKQDLWSLCISWQQNERCAVLLEVREVVKIVLLAILVIDVVCINARFRAEEDHEGFWSHCLRDTRPPLGQFRESFLLIKYRRRRSYPDIRRYSSFSFRPDTQKTR